MNQNSQEIRPNHWTNLVAEQETSGISQKEFCNQRGLVLAQFVYYRCRLKNKEKEAKISQPSFKPVKVVCKEAAQATGDIKLSLPNGFQFSFPCYIDSAQVKRLVEVLLSC